MSNAARRRLLLNKNVYQTYILGNSFGVGLTVKHSVPFLIYDPQDYISELKQVIFVKPEIDPASLKASVWYGCPQIKCIVFFFHAIRGTEDYFCQYDKIQIIDTCSNLTYPFWNLLFIKLSTSTSANT